MTKKTAKNNDLQLDAYEKDIVKSIERGEWRSVENFKEEKERAKHIARNTIKKNKKKAISVRLSELDLDEIKEKADKEGIPYQTLAGSVLHKFATNQISIRQ